MDFQDEEDLFWIPLSFRNKYVESSESKGEATEEVSNNLYKKIFISRASTPQML